jgi:hypothetical protein
MTYCYHCGRFTAGKPPFCQFCGRSYDVRLCPRLHPNPRFAEVCSQCGSRELSTPQPKVPLLWKALAFLLRVVLGILLVVLSLQVLIGMLRSSKVQSAMVVLGFLLLALWSMWTVLPDWLRKLIRWALTRRNDRHGR